VTGKMRKGLPPVWDDARVRREIAEAGRERAAGNRWTAILGVILVVVLTIILVVGI
jgi:hypothetical protein